MDNMSTISETTTEGVGLSAESFPIYHVAKLLWKVYSPIPIVLGTLGNIMSIIIMSRMPSGDSTVNTFFIAIAVGDLIVLYTGTMVRWVESLVGVLLKDWYPPLHYVHFYLVSCAGATVTWCLACVTLQRAVSVVWPHRVSLMCTKRRVKILIAAIVLFMVLLFSHQLLSIHDAMVSHTETSQSINSTAPSSTMGWVMENVFAYVDLVVFSLLPFCCLVVGNCVLVSKLILSASQARKTMVAGNTQQVLNRAKTTNAVTLTVLVVSLTFIILTLPACIYLILYYYKEQVEMSPQQTANVYFYYTVSFLLIDSNSSVNFYLYCLTGRKFREEFLKIVRCRMAYDSQGSTST